MFFSCTFCFPPKGLKTEDSMNSAVLLISSLPGWHITKIPLTKRLSRASVCLFPKSWLNTDPILSDLASTAEIWKLSSNMAPRKRQRCSLSIALCWLLGEMQNSSVWEAGFYTPSSAHTISLVNLKIPEHFRRQNRPWAKSCELSGSKSSKEQAVGQLAKLSHTNDISESKSQCIGHTDR